MLKKILVALDNSPVSSAVFEQALTIAKATNAQLMLLHIFFDDEEGHPLIAPFQGLATLSAQSYQRLQQQWKDYETEWQNRLRSYVERAEAAGVKAELTQSYGNPGRAICDWAWTWDADLIMVGRHGQHQMSGWRLGSVSIYVSQNAPCSVMMVDNGQRQRSPDGTSRQTVSAK
jgi:nucleotide-binding universal stress UspA family protein